MWADPELLLRVVDERLIHNLPSKYTAQDVWTTLFPEEVVGLPCTDFIIQTVLPRPRDIIFLVREAVGIAFNRGHSKVLPDDLLESRQRYSEYVFRSILKEDSPVKGKLENVLYEFAGASREVRKLEIEVRMAAAGVQNGDVGFYIDLLCDVGFLSIETTDGFKFPRDEGERQTMREVAKRLAAARNGDELFQISPAFYQVLQID